MSTEPVQEQFMSAYDKHADEIYRHCLLRVRDTDTARDLTQETFMKCWNYLSQGNSIEYMRAFLYRVANNLIIDLSRKKRSVSLDALQEDDGFEPVDPDSKDVTDTQAIRDAQKLLSRLDEKYRAIVTMRFLEDMSPSEISTILGVSENVVSVRLHRAIEKLRTLGKEVPPKK